MYFCKVVWFGQKEMKDCVKAEVRQILTDYLEQRNHRKTPERFAILDTVYSLNRRFSIQDLSDELEKSNFAVSRATIYNTINLFMKLRLVICHRLNDGTLYEACHSNENHCLQICSICGSVVELNVSDIADAIENIRLKRFRKERFSLYLYGTCSSCQARITRRKKKEQNIKQNI